MEYKRLAADQQRQLLEQRAANLEAEHFQTVITLTTLRAAAGPEPSEADVAKMDELESNLAVLDAAHAAVELELAAR